VASNFQSFSMFSHNSWMIILGAAHTCQSLACRRWTLVPVINANLLAFLGQTVQVLQEVDMVEQLYQLGLYACVKMVNLHADQLFVPVIRCDISFFCAFRCLLPVLPVRYVEFTCDGISNVAGTCLLNMRTSSVADQICSHQHTAY
jgi:hypothetical protein